jgi:hypothetical protein
MSGPNDRTYRAKATLWDLGETETGKEQVAVEFMILTPDADVDRITWFGFFTEKTFDRTIESLRIMGWTGNDLSDLQGLDTNEVDLVIADEEYKGKWTPKVRWVNRAGGFALKAPLSGEKKKAFAAQMRDRIKAFDASSGEPKPKAAPAQQPRRETRGANAGRPIPFDDAPPPMTDDDIPF